MKIYAARVLITTPSRIFLNDMDPPPPPRMRAGFSDVKALSGLFAIWMKRTRKQKNLTIASVNCISRSSVIKDLHVRQKESNESKDCNSADIISKGVQLEKQARKTSNFVFRDDVSKNEEGLNVRLLNSRAKTSSTKTAKSRKKGNKAKVSWKPATSETTWEKRSKAWTWESCSYLRVTYSFLQRMRKLGKNPIKVIILKKKLK